MTTTPQQIDNWRKASSEHKRLEFKEAKNTFSIQKLYAYCVAIANEGGGHLLLGLADKPPRPVVGTQAFQNPVKTEEKVFQKLSFRVGIEEVNHPEGRVLVFHIPSRPRGIPYQLEGKYLMRVGSTLVPMTEDRLRSIFAESPPDWNESANSTDSEAAVASLKQYISEPHSLIKFSDLVDETVKRIVEVTSGDSFSVDGPNPTSESATARVRGYEAASSTLLAMATVGGRWAEEEHFRIWQRALQQLGWTSPSGGYEIWSGLKKYPATLLLYALGLGAVEANRLHFLKHMLATSLSKPFQKDKPAVQVLPPFCLSVSTQEMRMLEGMDKNYAPLNDWIYNFLWSHAERIIPEKNQYTMAFDKLEILIALNYTHKVKSSPEP